jgi:hypothetical protein
MENNFISEAYKPAEKLAFDYFMLRGILSRLLQEQKFSKDIEAMLLKIYKNFQNNADKLISLYQDEKDVLSLNELLKNTEDESDSVFIDAGMDQPLLDEEKATSSLVDFLIDIETSYLDDAKNYVDAIPKFHWDIDSFKKAFNTVEKKAIDYVKEFDNE